jgi:hypothetical protein
MVMAKGGVRLQVSGVGCASLAVAAEMMPLADAPAVS